MAKSKARGFAYAAGAMNLALLLLTWAGKNTKFWTVAFLVVIAVLALAALFTSNWFRKPSLGIAEKIGRASVGIIAIGVGVGLLGWKTWPPTLSIAPSTVEFPKVANQNHIFTIRNRTDDDIYLAQVKFKLYPPSAKRGDVDLRLPMKSLKPIIENSPFSDMWGMWCRNERDEPFMTLTVWRLAPYETREVTITHIKADHLKVVAGTVYFTTVPQPRTAHPNNISNRYYTDELCHFDTRFTILANGSRLITHGSW